VEKAAKKGHPDGQYLLGSRLTANLYDAKKFTEGMNWLKKAAEKGQEEALVKLSTISRTRNPDTETAKYYDLKAAYLYAEKAALKGNVPSLKYCAEARLVGTGTTKNDSIALKYMRVAADKYNDAVACVRMGDFYLDGKFGGKSEPFEALAWYQRALSLPYLNMDQRNSAEYGFFKVDKLIRQTHNSMMMSSGMLPSGAFQYQIRKD
jgi:TPR repeat protein